MLTLLAATVLLKAPSVLVFTKTAGYRHESIPIARLVVGEIGKSRGWTVWLSENPALFNSEQLKTYDAVVFLLTTGDVLNDTQQSAFETYINSGGGYAGVHAAADTEYDWPFYGKVVGAYFKSHPKIQQATIRIEDAKDPSTSFLPAAWVHTDEWYCFKENPRSNVRVLATVDEKTYEGGTMGADHPIMWRNQVGQGRTWYTGLGHTNESYVDPLFRRVLGEGIASVLRKKK